MATSFIKLTPWLQPNSGHDDVVPIVVAISQLKGIASTTTRFTTFGTYPSKERHGNAQSNHFY